jgi:aerobic C4-dicarboxylate transport protein
LYNCLILQINHDTAKKALPQPYLLGFAGHNCRHSDRAFLPQLALCPVLSAAIQERFWAGPSMGVTISELLGTFYQHCKTLYQPIIFLTITLGIVSMGNLKKVGRVGAKALLYFEVVTTFALGDRCYCWHHYSTRQRCRHSQLLSRRRYLPIYPQQEGIQLVEVLERNFTLQVLFLALSGIGFKFLCGREKDNTLSFNRSQNIFSKHCTKVMLLAPIGAFGGMAYTISKYGINTLIAISQD